MPNIGSIQYGQNGNASSGYDFGFADSLDAVQNAITIPGGSADKQGYTLDIHPVYAPDQELDKDHRNSYDYKPEHRVRRSKYVDPFIPNFKLLVDFDKPYGLFAPETNPNSALAYIKRVFGENTPRYLMLKTFIEQFKIFLKEYDFLILSVEGLEELYNIYNKHSYVEESELKCSVNIRETVTMQLMGLIKLYGEIVYDPIRGVEVIPENLRRFDLYILIFSSGYFNSLYYDLINPITGQNYSNATGSNLAQNDDCFERKLFPTVYKLEVLRRLEKYAPANVEFNNFTFQLIDAQIDLLESGKKMFGEISNEMGGEIVKNNLAFTCRFLGLKGNFEQYTGGVDLMSLLALESNSKNKTGQSYFKGYASKAYNALRKTGIDIINNTVGSVFGTLKGLVAPTSPIGNALSLLASPEEIAKKLGNAVSVPINGLLNKYIDQPANWLQSMVEKNFRSDILTDLMHNATDGFFGIKQEGIQRDEIDAATINMKELNTTIDYKPDTKFKAAVETKQAGVAKTIEVKQNISEYIESKNKENVEVKPTIPEYQETENNSNIEVKDEIVEFFESKNKTNLEQKDVIPEYQETKNASNIELKDTINEFQDTKNNENLEQKDVIPEYQETKNASNIELKDTINEYKETENKTNLEQKDVIPEYVNTRNQTNLTYEELIEIFSPTKNATNIEQQDVIPEYQETKNASNIELKDTINEFQDTQNNNNITQQDVISSYDNFSNNQNIEVKDTINEYQETENANNLEVVEKINTYMEFENKSNITVEDDIDVYPDSTDTKKISLNTVEVSDNINKYPDSSDTKKTNIKSVKIKSPINTYREQDKQSDIVNPEVQDPIE